MCLLINVVRVCLDCQAREPMTADKVECSTPCRTRPERTRYVTNERCRRCNEKHRQEFNEALRQKSQGRRRVEEWPAGQAIADRPRSRPRSRPGPTPEDGHQPVSQRSRSSLSYGPEGVYDAIRRPRFESPQRSTGRRGASPGPSARGSQRPERQTQRSRSGFAAEPGGLYSAFRRPRCESPDRRR